MSLEKGIVGLYPIVVSGACSPESLRRYSLMLVPCPMAMCCRSAEAIRMACKVAHVAIIHHADLDGAYVVTYPPLTITERLPPGNRFDSGGRPDLILRQNQGKSPAGLVWTDHLVAVGSSPAIPGLASRRPHLHTTGERVLHTKCNVEKETERDGGSPSQRPFGRSRDAALRSWKILQEFERALS